MEREKRKTNRNGLQGKPKGKRIKIKKLRIAPKNGAERKKFMSSVISANKTYHIMNARATTRRLNLYSSGTAANGMNVVLYTNDNTNEQKWYFDGDRLYPETNRNYCLDRYTASTYLNNADIWKASASDAAAQLVDVVKAGDYCNIRLRTKVNGEYYYLTAVGDANGSGSGKSTASKGNVYWAPSLGSSSLVQKWMFTEVDGSSSGGGTYQKLIMPINQSVITVCYKENAPAYHEQGFSDPMHYAIDMTGTPRNFYASGDGTIVGYSATNSGPLGKWLAVRYDKVEGVDGKKYDGLVLRYCHLDDIYKTSGEVHINDEDAMARYGKTGTKSAHLHVEVDTDTVNYNKTPTIKGNSNGLVPAGNDDTTIDPFLVFHKKISEPENQSVSWSQSYCDKDNCSICAQYTQYEPGKVPYVNIEQCRNVPEIS